jgi:hypothetical protein
VRYEDGQSNDDRDDRRSQDGTGCNVFRMTDVLIRLERNGVGESFDRSIERLG